MDDQVKRKRGRQLTYDRETAHAICVRLARGETLRGICRDEEFPPESTVRTWALEDVDGFAARYTLARQLGLDSMADQLLEISDDGRNAPSGENEQAVRSEPNRAYGPNRTSRTAA
jgi:hypothetical protein